MKPNPFPPLNNVHRESLTRHVARWGNSLAVRIPAAIVEVLDLKPGDEIEIRVAGDRAIEISRDNRKEAALASLRRLRKLLPADYRLDRHEAHER